MQSTSWNLLCFRSCVLSRIIRLQAQMVYTYTSLSRVPTPFVLCFFFNPFQVEVFHMGESKPMWFQCSRKGSRLKANNYRPIILTSTIVKILEPIIRTDLLTHLMKNSILDHQQHGFVGKKSCLTNFLSVVRYASIYGNIAILPLYCDADTPTAVSILICTCTFKAIFSKQRWWTMRTMLTSLSCDIAVIHLVEANCGSISAS